MQEDSPLKILNISDILPNRFQPRIKFDDDKLGQLAKSIDRFGVIEPIVVRPIGSKYEVIAGERRFKASKLVSKSTIPAIVLNLTDKESEEIALLENVQRQSLSPIEEAAQYKRILDNGYISREELAKKLGKSESSILGKVRLLSLSDEVQSYLLNNKISERHARSLLKINNLDDQEAMLHRIVDERLTVKATDREIRKYVEESLDDTELLFDDERGIDKMDIDKIMREAKDINEPKEEVRPTVDLMANNNPVIQEEPSEETAVEVPQMPTEPNKFVNTIIDNSVDDSNGGVSQNSVSNSVVSQNNVSNNGVTFDSMFNSPISPIDNLLKPEPSVQNSATNEESVLQDSDTTNGVQPISETNTETHAPTVFNESVSLSENNELPAINNNEKDNNVINNLPGTDAFVSTEPNFINTPLNDSLPVDSTLPGDIVGVNNDLPINSPIPTDVNNNLDNTIVTGNLLNGNEVPEGGLSSDVSIDNPILAGDVNNGDGLRQVEVTSLNSPSLDNEGKQEIVKKDISTIVADAFRKFSDMPETPLNKTVNNVSIPDTDIYDNEQDVVNNSGNRMSQIPTVSENINQDEVKNSHKFADIVKMLRDCADNIENMGYMINVDEMDLDSEYKVIFTIKKD